MRDDFSAEVKRIVAARVGHRCSNPDCYKQTSGPQDDPIKALNIGVAAHITAAAPGGPRYDPSLTPEERRSIKNAIWLCQNCAKLIDNDPGRFSVELIRLWKVEAEAAALDQIMRAATTDIAHDPSISQIWNIPYPPNRFFTGRQKALDQIREALVMGGASALTQSQAISGLGGIGKTQTAVQYAYQWYKEYKAVLWTKADSRESLNSGFVAIARLLSLPEVDVEKQTEVVESVLQWLQDNPTWLLIFDNADDPDLIEDFIPAKHNGHVLLTSRARVFDKLGIANPIKLEKMLPDEAVELLQKRTGCNDPEVEENKAIARLAQELDYLPLAIEQAAAYINKTMCSFQSYLECYSGHGLVLLEKSAAVVGKYDKSVATTWLLNFEQVERAARASADLLRASAFLDPDSIPIEILINGAGELGPAISTTLLNLDSYPLALDELLKPASDYSLISRDTSARTYSIHRLVQAVLRQQLNEADKRLWAERVTRAINGAIPEPDFSTWQEFERFLPHAQACASFIEKFNLTSKDAAHLLLLIGKYFRQLNNLGELYRQQGKYSNAESFYKRAIKIYENLDGAERNYELATALSNLGLAYYFQGKHEEAESLYLRSITIEENCLGPEHPRLAQGLNNLALIRTCQCEYDEAIRLFERAIAIWQKKLGPEHPEMARGLDNLGKVHHELGNYAVAEPLYKRALRIMEKAFGHYHNETLESVLNLWTLYFEQKRYDDAKPYYHRFLKTLTGGHRVDHSKMARLMMSQSNHLREMGLSFEGRKWGALAKEVNRNPFSDSKGVSNLANLGKKKVGRNETCPCGSGKKFKKCCGT